MTARSQDINGWFEIKDNPLSKVGVFPYLGSSIDRDGEMGLNQKEIYMVYRPAEELKEKECIDSFKLLPWIDDHEMLGGDMTPAENKGVEGVIGEDVYFDDTDLTLKGNVKVFSENLKSSIDDGKKDLSLGYRCKYELNGGNFDGERYHITQRKIRGNHLALVDQGRMGPEVSVLDSSERFSFTIDSKEFGMPDEKKEDNTTEDAEMSLSQITAALKKIMPDIQALNEAMEVKKEEILGAEDEEAEDAGGNGPSKDETETEDMEEEKSSGMDAIAKENKNLKKEVAALKFTMDGIEDRISKSINTNAVKKEALVSSLSAQVGTFDASDMDLSDVAKYGCEKLELPFDKGSEFAVLSGFLHNRQPKQTGHALDSKAKISGLDTYINGGEK